MLGLFDSKRGVFILEKAGEYAAQNADCVMKKRWKEVKKALDLVSLMQKKSKTEGLWFLKKSIADIKRYDAPCVDFLLEQIIVINEDLDIRTMAEIMVNAFLVRKPNDFEALVLYIYILALIMVQEQFFYEFICWREDAWKEMVRIRNEYIRFLPEECKKFFEI